MEMALWLCLFVPLVLDRPWSSALLPVFLFPGLFYTVWRSTAVRLRCPACGSDALIPEESFRAVKMVQADHTFTRPDLVSPPPVAPTQTIVAVLVGLAVTVVVVFVLA
jgi:hypothetical protein